MPLKKSPLSNNLKNHTAPSALHLTPRRASTVRHGIPKEGIDVCSFHVSFHSRLPPLPSSVANLTRLHLGGKYSDLTVKCNSREYNVHRAILCSRSGFFDGACSNQFREAKTGLIDLSEEDEEAVEHMIHCKSLTVRVRRDWSALLSAALLSATICRLLVSQSPFFLHNLTDRLDFYHLDYLTPEDEDEPASPVFRHRAQEALRQRPQKLDLSHIVDPLFAQAAACAPPTPITPTEGADLLSQARHDSSVDRSPRAMSPKGKIGLRGASAGSASGSGSECDSDEDDDCEYETDDSNLLTHTRVYALAEKYDIPALKALAKSKFEMAMACYYDSPEFADAIEEVYCSTIDNDRGLRDVVIQAFRNHPQLASTQDVFGVIKRTPTLAFELWKTERGIPV